jgi:uncharacterized protein
VCGLAATYTDRMLRSLDAIHLATAQVLAAELAAPAITFVTYDKRLLAAAGAAGLATSCPGS